MKKHGLHAVIVPLFAELDPNLDESVKKAHSYSDVLERASIPAKHREKVIGDLATFHDDLLLRTDRCACAIAVEINRGIDAIKSETDEPEAATFEAVECGGEAPPVYAKKRTAGDTYVPTTPTADEVQLPCDTERQDDPDDVPPRTIHGTRGLAHRPMNG